MEVSAIMDGLRSFFVLIDGWVYSFIGFLYDLITKIATTELVTELSVNQIANKLYSFVGIFMLFKLSFSLINYIINPDSITDKEKGGTKIITNIVITFGLIIFVPVGFDWLYQAQEAIIADNILPRIILETDGAAPGVNEFSISPKCTDDQGNQYNPIYPGGSWTENGVQYNAGEYISMMTIRPFYQVHSSVSEDQINDLIDNYHYCTADTIDKLLTARIVNHPNKSGEIYTINYIPLIPTIVGIILALIFVGFVLDVALRTVKLAFLEVIAPIPIISYIDPSSAKKGLFMKWLKEVGMTWADLFLRLAAVFFAIYLISVLELSNAQDSMLVNVFLILGILMFAKKLPDMLKKLLNIDVKGDFKLNPLKKLQDSAIGGKQIAGVMTGAAAATLGGLTSFRGNSIRDRFANAKKGFTSGLTGGYKNPSTLKGLGTGMAPYKEIRKKEKEEQKKAESQLKEFDRYEKMGSDLIAKSIVRDGKGNPVTEVDEKGNIKYKVTAESKAARFSSPEYKESFLRVENAKSDLKSAKKNYDAAQSELTRLNAQTDPIDLNVARAELQRLNSITPTNAKEKAELDAKKTQITNAMRATETLKEQRESALKKVQESRESVEKRENILSGAKERHKIVQQKYKEEAVKENSMNEYLDRNPDALNVPNVSAKNVVVDSANNVSIAQAADTNRSDIQPNNSVSPTTSEPTNPHHQEFKTVEEILEQKNRDLADVRAERAKLDNVYGDGVEEERSRLAREEARIQYEMQQAELEKIRLMEKYPEEAMEELQFESGNLEAEVQVATENYNVADEKLRTFSRRATDQNYVAGEDYLQADREHDEAYDAKRDAESRRDEVQDKINELNRKISKQESVEKEDHSSEIKALEEEKARINDQLEDMRAKKGHTYANISVRGKQLQERLYEIDDEINRLKRQ